jgi:hypothetical protein
MDLLPYTPLTKFRPAVLFRSSVPTFAVPAVPAFGAVWSRIPPSRR